MRWLTKLLLALILALLSEIGALWLVRAGHLNLLQGLGAGPLVLLLALLSTVVWWFSFPARATRLVTKAWGKKDERARLRRAWKRGHVWLLAWRMPDGATATFYRQNLEALETSLRSSVVVSERNGLVCMRLGRKRLPAKVEYGKFTARADPVGGLPVPGGVSREGTLWIDLAKVFNLLVGGAIGGGKSTLLNSIIVWIAERYRPEEVQLLLFDLKSEDGVEFGIYGVLKHLVRPVVTRLEDCLEAFQQLEFEVDRRYGLLRAAGVKKLEDYNELPAALKIGKGLPAQLSRLVVIVDEFAEIGGILDNKLLNRLMALIESLTRIGRAAGIHFIFATQRPDVSVVPGQIRNNLPATMAYYCSDDHSSGVLLGPGDFRAASLDPADPGLAIWKYRKSIRVRTVLLTAEEAERRVEALGGITVQALPASTVDADEMELDEEPRRELVETPKALRVLQSVASSLSGWQMPLTSRVSSRW